MFFSLMSTGWQVVKISGDRLEIWWRACSVVTEKGLKIVARGERKEYFGFWDVAGHYMNMANWDHQRRQTQL
jgi:hypothetical protein